MFREKKKQCPAVYLLQCVLENTEKTDEVEEKDEEEEGGRFTSQWIKTSKYGESC